jgi:predicted ester cyclase
VPQTIAQWRYSGKVVQLAFIFRVGRTVCETAFIAASAASRFTRPHLRSPATERQHLPPTGKSFAMAEIAIFRMEGSKIVEKWGRRSAWHYRQLGIHLLEAVHQGAGRRRCM